MSGDASARGRIGGTVATSEPTIGGAIGAVGLVACHHSNVLEKNGSDP